ncbi:MAG: hypothetical protein IPJ88_16975 [Myxococcales bacterium]|nr:MAG: hypothetical protein IPJ88_16975 [Myxococcales bacterium]
MSLPSLSGTPFSYQNGTLHIDGVSLERIAEATDTPCFVYSSAAIEKAYKAIDASLSFAPHEISYAVKANGNLAILNLLRELGSGADIVSGGELARCQKAGFSSERIVFSGVGKSKEELYTAIKAKIRSIHVESEAELDHINAICQELKCEAKLSFRVNPNIDAKTHPYISTGLKSTNWP